MDGGGTSVLFTLSQPAVPERLAQELDLQQRSRQW
jgi:hypothetical protein